MYGLPMGFKKFCHLKADTFFSGTLGSAGLFFLKMCRCVELLDSGDLTPREVNVVVRDPELLLKKNADD